MQSDKLYNIAKIILLIARIWGILILAFVLFFLIAGIFGGGEPGGGLKKNEIMSFFFFPCCTIIGLAVAFKWEGLGGLIATMGIVGLFIVRIDLLAVPIFIIGIAPPGILYMIYWIIIKVRTNKYSKMSIK